MALAWSINYTLVHLSKRVKTKERICCLLKMQTLPQSYKWPQTRLPTAAADHPPVLALHHMTLWNNSELCVILEHIVLEE